MAKMKACPVCGQKVGIEKLAAHVKKVHPREKVDIELDEEEQKEVRAAKKASRPSTGSGGKWIVLLTAVVIVVIVLAFTLAPSGVTEPTDFTLTPSDSTTPWNLRSHISSKPILLEFMHPDCEVCKNEVDVASPYYPAYSLKDLWSNYASEVEIVSIAVRLDREDFRNPPTAQMMNEFKVQYDTMWTYLVDTGTTVRDQYQIGGTPTFILIGKSSTGGKIIYRQESGGDLTKLKSEIDKELAR